MSSPTIIYHRTVGNSFITVTTVKGSAYVQQYSFRSGHRVGLTVLDRSEEWRSEGEAMDRAEVFWLRLIGESKEELEAYCERL